MKVEDGGVHSKRYDGCCTNNELEFQSPHETPKNLIPFDGVANWDGVLKSINRLKGDHVMHI